MTVFSKPTTTVNGKGKYSRTGRSKMIVMQLAELWRQINEKKQELYRYYREQGISSNVLKVSMDLDKLINQYIMLTPLPYYKGDTVQK